MGTDLAKEAKRVGTVSVNYEKLAGILTPQLAVQLSAHDQALQAAFVQASAPMLAELEKGRTALNDAGAVVTMQVTRASEQIEKLGGVVTWRMVGQIATVLLPLALAMFMVFGVTQTIWVALGFQPILQTIWGWFLSASQWYWKLAIAGGAGVVLAAFGCLTWWIGKKLGGSYSSY
ncbi:hypothetical protein [Arthrobacter glacialis]|uniref:Uncharacterized protein n=1 Tax=Arthrobacter glacialis TaxID=1664 RepID=A0A2S3ZW22_ARTGL|nr:hypothetical protein [Arthrobacter glacialis]POH73466.1 hypothetical protein CVS27_11200 [Arthrobacter glacialis]